MSGPDAFGRTIQLFLVDGSPSGLIIASIHGWTGSVLVSTQSTFDRLLARPEVDRTGLYILYGPDPKDNLRMRAYIGEADSVSERIGKSAKDHGFWVTAVVVTTSDEALTKGHGRYLEARLIEMTKKAGRVSLDNGQHPDAERRRLPEADQANMEAFLANLKVVLPVIGLDDLLKPHHAATLRSPQEALGTVIVQEAGQVQFEIRHKSGVKAICIEEDGEFVVLEGSEALKDTKYKANESYGELKEALIAQDVLVPTEDGSLYRFSRSYSFKSPSAAAAVVLDRNSNGRTEWKLVGSELTYHAWQEAKAGLSGDKA